jgi:hypothetical protein
LEFKFEVRVSYFSSLCYIFKFHRFQVLSEYFDNSCIFFFGFLINFWSHTQVTFKRPIVASAPYICAPFIIMCVCVCACMCTSILSKQRIILFKFIQNHLKYHIILSFFKWLLENIQQNDFNEIILNNLVNDKQK